MDAFKCQLNITNIYDQQSIQIVLTRICIFYMYFSKYVFLFQYDAKGINT